MIIIAILLVVLASPALVRASTLPQVVNPSASTSYAAEQPVAASLSLQQGWNLVAGTNQTPEQFIKVNPCTVVIYNWYNANSMWKAYYTQVPGFSTLLSIDAGNAYWVYCIYKG